MPSSWAIGREAKRLINLGLRRPLQLLQAASGFIQCGVGLAEAETHLLAAEGRIAVETAAGNGSHADVPDKVPGEAHVIRKSESGDIRHHIIGAPRLEAAEANLLQKGYHAVSPREVTRPQTLVVRLRQPQRCYARFLQRCS